MQNTNPERLARNSSVASRNSALRGTAQGEPGTSSRRAASDYMPFDISKGRTWTAQRFCWSTVGQ